MDSPHGRRTPEQHRTEVAWIWAQWAPANDSEIFGSRPRTSSPRHAALGDALSPVREWRRLTSGDNDTWLAANDNLEDAGCSASAARLECEHEIRPSLNDLLRGLDEPDAPGAFPARQLRPDTQRPGFYRIGRLIFDAELKLVGWKTDGGKERRPIERFGTPYGSTQTEEAPVPTTGRPLRREHFRERPTDTRHFAYVPWSFSHPKRIDPDKQEAHSLFGGATHLDEARARAGLPPVAATVDAASVPTIYLGGRCTCSPRGGPPGHYSALDQIIDAETAALAQQQMSADDLKALEAVFPAANFADVGAAVGYAGKTAERQGKARLLKAAANFRTFLAKHAA